MPRANSTTSSSPKQWGRASLTPAATNHAAASSRTTSPFAQRSATPKSPLAARPTPVPTVAKQPWKPQKRHHKNPGTTQSSTKTLPYAPNSNEHSQHTSLNPPTGPSTPPQHSSWRPSMMRPLPRSPPKQTTPPTTGSR
ncbi:hypothetical protein ACA910_009503 [Epithemia clementina (nom. ined.)]